MRQNGKFLKHTKTEGKTEVAQTAQEAVEESKSKCCGGRTDPATRAATAAAARFGRLESCSAALLGPPYVLFSRPQALASPPFTCTHCSRKRWPGLAAEASITITSAAAGLTTTADDQIKEMPSQ